MGKIHFTKTASFSDVINHALEELGDRTDVGFEYVVGHILNGKVTVRFEPWVSCEAECSCIFIDGVNGFGYTLLVEEE